MTSKVKRSVTKTEAIKNFLRLKTHPDLAELYNANMEVQVSVAQGGGERIQQEYEGRRYSAYTDGLTTWKSLRIPRNASSEPQDNDGPMNYNLGQHAEGIGLTGWNWRDRVSKFCGFDFDSISGHAEGHRGKLTDEELAEVKRKAMEIPWVTVRKSTGGKGIHLYVFLPDVPTANHTEHAALARAILGRMSARVGYDFEAKVDACGSILWIWHRKMLGTDGLALIKQGEILLEIPPDWRDQLDVVSGRRRTVVQVLREDSQSDRESAFEPAGQQQRVPLDADHQKLLDFLSENNLGWSWVQDQHMLRTHTASLKKAHTALELKGPFETASTGRNPQDINCFAFPMRNGAWVVRRYGNGTTEAVTWSKDRRGNMWCFLNRERPLQRETKILSMRCGELALSAEPAGSMKATIKARYGGNLIHSGPIALDDSVAREELVKTLFSKAADQGGFAVPSEADIGSTLASLIGQLAEVEANGRKSGREVPKIIITTREYEVIEQAVAALATDSTVYQRSHMLVSVRRDPVKARNIERSCDTPQIVAMPSPRIRELMTKTANWMRVDHKTLVNAHPPGWAVAGVAARGEWPPIRPLEAVVETPILRPDGSLLDVPGYDGPTRLLYEPNATFHPVPANPTRDDARRAAEDLLHVVCDFPFVGPAHRAAWLASQLTPLARFAIDGPCPLFFFDANTPGSGKSKLTDLIALVATGRNMPRTAYPDGDEEMRKRITAVALSGDRLMLIDNIATSFGGSSLDSALTAVTWRDRILGRSEMTSDLPLIATWYGSGNNVVLKGDAVRRVVPCRLETPEERPEERRDFTIQGDLLAYVRRERPRLVAAALTLLLAHARAGRPDGGLTPLGSFEAWSLVVRSAVFWALDLDPCATREELRDADPEEAARAALVAGWAELPGGRIGLTAAEALDLLRKHDVAEITRTSGDPTRFATLRTVMREWERTGHLPSPRTIGMRLKAVKGRVVNGLVLRSKVRDNTQVWWVEDAPAKGTTGTTGT